MTSHYPSLIKEYSPLGLQPSLLAVAHGNILQPRAHATKQRSSGERATAVSRDKAYFRHLHYLGFGSVVVHASQQLVVVTLCLIARTDGSTSHQVEGSSVAWTYITKGRTTHASFTAAITQQKYSDDQRRPRCTLVRQAAVRNKRRSHRYKRRGITDIISTHVASR